MSTRWQETDAPRGDDYDARWRTLAADGQEIHGEADLVDGLLSEIGGSRVLDAGCGTGRVAIELARRGRTVVGVDLDEAMLDTARAEAPELTWLRSDLTAVAGLADAPFDVVVLAGNVMIFVAPGTEVPVLSALTAQLAPTGLLVAGFQLDRLPVDRYDAFAADAGLRLVARWATWEREPFTGGDYAVSVHARMAG
ncbi:class I SAM-dependent methyltransferase [Mycolicibacterium sediminis]|uniref:SAM-dependent methyltransferase n=1 Tax=Mycolicibacterium sediminis TaxID=1286180 RepID=A0A7I7QWE0_9MYCO|nr:class I SAM-dependent methyltransferase [Mycolicibacterium sediminis]BBY30226.1 SAM-dependent methyltransferase [Mycolicibacterium sediminis]